MNNDLILSMPHQRHQDKALLAQVEADPIVAAQVVTDVASSFRFLSTSIYTDHMSGAIAMLMQYPRIFGLAKENISQAIGRALDRAEHPVPFQGFGRTMTPACVIGLYGHLSAGDPREHFAVKEFIEQLRVLDKKPEFLAEVVTPEMAEKAARIVTFTTGWNVYKYAPDLFDITDKYPQFQDAIQQGVLQTMHLQLSQSTREAQRLGLEWCQQVAQDLMPRAEWASFLATTVETNPIIAGALGHLFPSASPGSPVAKEKLGKPGANGEALTA